MNCDFCNKEMEKPGLCIQTDIENEETNTKYELHMDCLLDIFSFIKELKKTIVVGKKTLSISGVEIGGGDEVNFTV